VSALRTSPFFPSPLTTPTIRVDAYPPPSQYNTLPDEFPSNYQPTTVVVQNDEFPSNYQPTTVVQNCTTVSAASSNNKTPAANTTSVNSTPDLECGRQPQIVIKTGAAAGSCEMPTTNINCPTLVPKYFYSPNNEAVPCATEQLDVMAAVDNLSKPGFADKLPVEPSPKPPFSADDDAPQLCGNKISISLSLAVPPVSLDNPVGKNSTGVATVTGTGAGTSQEDAVEQHTRPVTDYKACPSPQLHGKKMSPGLALVRLFLHKKIPSNITDP
jgi:hypothetical protein